MGSYSGGLGPVGGASSVPDAGSGADERSPLLIPRQLSSEAIGDTGEDDLDSYREARAGSRSSVDSGPAGEVDVQESQVVGSLAYGQSVRDRAESVSNLAADGSALAKQSKSFFREGWGYRALGCFVVFIGGAITLWSKIVTKLPVIGAIKIAELIAMIEVGKLKLDKQNIEHMKVLMKHTSRATNATIVFTTLVSLGVAPAFDWVFSWVGKAGIGLLKMGDVDKDDRDLKEASNYFERANHMAARRIFDLLGTSYTF